MCASSWIENHCQTVCKPGSVSKAEALDDDHSSGTSVAGRLTRHTRTAARKTRLSVIGRVPDADQPSLLGLAPGGVYPAIAVTGDAVRSYRTVSSLPAKGTGMPILWSGGLFSVALSLRSPSPGVTRHRVFRGARTFLPARDDTERPSNRLTGKGDRVFSKAGQSICHRPGPASDDGAGGDRIAAATWHRRCRVSSSRMPSIRPGRKCR